MIFGDWDLAANQAKLFLTGYLIELSLSIDNLVQRFSLLADWRDLR